MNIASEDLQGYFSSLYGSSDDPYLVGARWFEKRKRALLLAALPKDYYQSAYEPACGTGLLSVDLAMRCKSLLISDSDSTACSIATRNTAHLTNVTLQHHALPHDWPAQSHAFDLIVLSELLYFLDEEQLAGVVHASTSSLAPAGDIVLCNWKPDFKQRRCSTDDISASFMQHKSLTRIVLLEEAEFRLEVYSSSAESVAQREGLA